MSNGIIPSPLEVPILQIDNHFTVQISVYPNMPLATNTTLKGQDGHPCISTGRFDGIWNFVQYPLSNELRSFIFVHDLAPHLPSLHELIPRVKNEFPNVHIPDSARSQGFFNRKLLSFRGQHFSNPSPSEL